MAASRTMILLDPDLSPPNGQTPVRPHPARGPRNARADSRRDTFETRIPSARTLARFMAQAQAEVKLRGQVTVLLTTDAAIRRLNRQFRGKNKATDVLSFPAGGPIAQEVAGDLAISIPTAMRQAKEHGHPLATEIKVLMLHGLLHLAGYDHEADKGQMARRELLLRGRLKLPKGLIERSGGSAEDGDPTPATERSRKDGARKVKLKPRAARTTGASTRSLRPIAQDDSSSNGRRGRRI